LLCAQLRYIYAYRGSKTHRDVKSRERAFSSSLCFVITAAPLFNLTATYLHLLYSCLNFLLAICAGERRSARASLSFYSRACTGEHGNSSSHQELAGRKKFCLCFGRRDAECALCLVPVDRFAFKLFFLLGWLTTMAILAEEQISQISIIFCVSYTCNYVQGTCHQDFIISEAHFFCHKT
jgi:hypothetical protein